MDNSLSEFLFLLPVINYTNSNNGYFHLNLLSKGQRFAYQEFQYFCISCLGMTVKLNSRFEI